MTTFTVEEIKAFVSAGHGNLDVVKATLAAKLGILNQAHEWRPGDRETAIQAAAHVGSVPVAEYLLDQGAPLEICTAAMLGRAEDVRQMLTADPDLAQATGAHGISLLYHGVLSGDIETITIIKDAGGQMDAAALHAAVNVRSPEIVKWLLDNGADDLSVINFKGQTPLEVANERRLDAIIPLLQA